MTNLNLNDLLTVTRGKAHGFHSPDVSFSGINIDSRQIQPEELFWALPGQRFNGHDFACDALQQGASGCVVEAGQHQSNQTPAIIVRDTLQALHDYAAWHRRQQDALVIGVTGSVGKTTTRTMIHSVLSAEFSGTQSQKNYNNNIGLPLSVLEIESRDEFAVLELGASRPGEIRELSSIANPEIGVITEIGLAHLASFGTREQIIATKSELLEQLPINGFAVLPGDDENIRRMAGRAPCPVLFVGEDSRSDIQFSHLESTNYSITFLIDGRQYTIPATGRHHMRAAAIAIGIAREIGLTTQVIDEGLRNFHQVNGRCRPEQIGPWDVIDDSYNASPESTIAACEVLDAWQGTGRKIIVCGDMLELGSRGNELHRQIGHTIANTNIDYLIAYGQFSSDVVAGALHAGMDRYRVAECDTLEAMLAVLDCWIEPEDVILLKGSRGMKLERVVDWMKKQSLQMLQDNSHFASAQPERICA